MLTLGALRSPFAPPDLGFAALWLLTLLSAEVRRPHDALAFLLLSVPLPLPTGALILSIVQQTTLLALVIWFIVRPARP